MPTIYTKAQTIRDLKDDEGGELEFGHYQAEHRRNSITCLPNTKPSSLTGILRPGIPGEDRLSFEAIRTLAGGFLMCFVAGSILAFGSLVPYIVSYYRMILKYDINEDTF